MKKLFNFFCVLRMYLAYIIKARHRKGHGIHSPHIFNLVNKVFFDRTIYSDYSFFKNIRQKLLESDLALQVENIGTDSNFFKSDMRSVSDLVKVSSVKPKFGKLLYRLVRYYKPATIIELGTSIGLSTIYLARGNKNAQVITVEGNYNLCDFAKNSFKYNKIHNISVKNGMFDDLLDEISDQIIEPAFIFIDGSHSYKSTLRYFNYFAERISEGIIVLDDIHWSNDMHKAWKEIIQTKKNQATIDFFYMGMVVCKTMITPRNYTIRF